MSVRDVLVLCLLRDSRSKLSSKNRAAQLPAKQWGQLLELPDQNGGTFRKVSVSGYSSILGLPWWLRQ